MVPILEELRAAAIRKGQTFNPPLTLEQVHLAEERLGYPLPDLLRSIYIEVGNGGAGPGNGLLPLAGEYPQTVLGLTESDNESDQHGIMEEYLPLFEWDGQNYGYVHIVEDDHVILVDDDYLQDEFNRNRPLHDQYPVIADSLERLFLDYLKDEPLTSESYKTLSQ